MKQFFIVFKKKPSSKTKAKRLTLKKKVRKALHEVMLHERVSHAKLRKELKYQCECCEEKFPTKQSCDTHLLSHFENSIGEVWDRVEEMQNKLTGLVVVDQCPICLAVMGTRKSFRLHIIQKHLLKDPQDFLEVLSLSPLVFQKFAIQQDTPWFTFASEAVSNGAVVKKEIKQECVEC
ncbi:zinc finger, C2H2 type [Teladorsagia circumcincta]|uniref:Zinc finger, C2H2 type n=1 Tax=Teladorsagia circumcincta TaxID=45464 RepID=A0A2G9V2K8_TELCI|nr:zinc finger, C2H2 type [Teladorsagia circumcincta]